ncbi:MAG: MFS transporter [Pseudomonas sp.]|nr:MFS transporter [Pseudomonas sp.]
MRLSKFVTSERRRPLHAGAVLWQLTQMLWVGGVWLLHIGLLPVLGQIGLAPLLIEEIGSMLSALLVGFTVVCGILQALVLIQAEGLRSLWRDIRGQLLLLVLYACAMYFVVRVGWPEAVRWQLFSYLVLGFSGLVLVLQPVPGWSGRVREAHP